MSAGDPAGASSRSRGYGVFLGLACAVLALQVVLLALENRRLRQGVQAADERGPPARSRLRVGDVLGPFTLLGADGHHELVAFGPEPGPTLLLVFADQCPACPAAMADWDEVVPDYLAASARVLGLRLDPPVTGEGASAALPRVFPVFTLTDASEVPLAQLSTVPLTVVLDRRGVVRFARYGALSIEDKHELVRLLGTG